MYLRPRTLSEASEALARGGRVLAGGTDFFPALGDRPSTGIVIDVTALTEIQGISIAADHIRIGGATTWSEIVATPLPRRFDALRAAAREVGGVQIQNRGTIAGNLCNASPAADGVPPLLVLDAEVELVSAAGRRRVRVSDFIVGNRKTVRRPDEILATVVIPCRGNEGVSAFLKLGARRYLVISIAMVAALLVPDEHGRIAEARVAVGACSVTAQRLTELETVLAGAPFGPGLGSLVKPEHLSRLSPIDDVRAPAAYRTDAALLLVRRVLELCAGSHA
ncbi:MAG: FAD binding domain-containing protein [Acidobacteriia bacterium]|nr:FAD binding domain-containing protein [Terriglobia bacterium]